MGIEHVIVTILVTGLFNGLVMFGIVKTELKYLRRDIDRAHKRIDDVVKAL